MSKTKIVRVINNRMAFRCPACGARRNMAVPPSLRRKNVRCHKCGEVTKCMFNRRVRHREMQAGRVEMVMGDGRLVEVDLHDVSPEGVGIDIPIGSVRMQTLHVGSKVRFRCKWNPRLLDRGYFEVKNIYGHRIGARKC